MYHPIVAKAKRLGAWSVLADAGSDTDRENDTVYDWHYDSTLDDPEIEMMKSGPVAFFPLTKPTVQLNNNAGARNFGTGPAGGQSPGVFSRTATWSASPVCGPDRFNKADIAWFYNTDGSANQTLVLDSGTNPVGLTQAPFSMGFWYKINSPTNVDNFNKVICQIKDESAGAKFEVLFRLDYHVRPMVIVTDGNNIEKTLECKCGVGTTGSSEYETTYYNDEWHYLVLTVADSGGRLNFFFDGREVDGVTLDSDFVDPPSPDINLYINRTAGAATNGFASLFLKSVAVWNRELTSHEIRRHYQSMFRASDFRRDDIGTVLYKDSDQQPLRRGDNMYMPRLTFQDTSKPSANRELPGGAGSTQSADWNEFYNHFGNETWHKNASDPKPDINTHERGAGNALMVFSQWCGPFNVTAANERLYQDEKAGHWNDRRCPNASETSENVMGPPHGFYFWRVGRTVHARAWGRYGGNYNDTEFTSSSTFLDQGLSNTLVGKFDSLAISMNPSPTALGNGQVKYWWGKDHEVDNVVNANDLPFYGEFADDNSKNHLGIGPVSNGGDGDGNKNRSIIGPVCLFPNRLDETAYNEVRRVFMHQVPMRTRRPTRALTRQTALMAPMRVME